MQPQCLTRRYQVQLDVCLLIVLCCMVIFLSGCSDLLSGLPDSPTSTPTNARPTATLIPVRAKADSQGIPTEALTRAQFEKVQSIMAG